MGLIPSATSTSMLTDTVVATTTSKYSTSMAPEQPSTVSQGRSLATDEYHSSEENGFLGAGSTTVSTTTTTTEFVAPIAPIVPADETYGNK